MRAEEVMTKEVSQRGINEVIDNLKYRFKKQKHTQSKKERGIHRYI